MIPGMAAVKYDVCVIGSGAAGGVMTKQLCEAGAKVVLLEAGREVKPAEYRSHCMPYEMQFRGLRGEKQEPFYPGDIQNAIRYEDSDGIGVDRIRVLGGRTVHWNAVVLRFAAQDFREHSVNRSTPSCHQAKTRSDHTPPSHSPGLVECRTEGSHTACPANRPDMPQRRR